MLPGSYLGSEGHVSSSALPLTPWTNPSSIRSRGPDGSMQDDGPKRLEDLLKMGRFPSLPEEWADSEFVVTWHSKVDRSFIELKTCDSAGFGKICDRLKGELQVRAQSTASSGSWTEIEHRVTTRGSFVSRVAKSSPRLRLFRR